MHSFNHAENALVLGEAFFAEFLKSGLVGLFCTFLVVPKPFFYNYPFEACLDG